MTDIVQFQASNLPATLQARLAKFTAGNILSGVAGGVELDRISIRGGRFRIKQAGMEEVTLQQFHLDGIMAFANPHLSKAYYTKSYDKDAEDQSPDCASSNGFGPDTGVKNPQSNACATCPQAIWGSKISASGKKVKACGDSQRVAFMPIDPATNNFFMVDGKPKAFAMSVPAGSLKNISTYAKTLAQRGLPLEIALTRLTFDESADGQRLMFAFNAVLPDQAANYILDYIEQNDARLQELVGANIKKMENVQVAAPVQPAVPAPQAAPQPAPVQAAPAPMAQPMPTFAPQVAPVQVAPAPVAEVPSPMVQPMQAAPAPVAAAPASLLSALQGVMG